MYIALVALLAGIAAGCRSMTPVAVIALAARGGMLRLADTRFAFLEHGVWAYVLCALALGELVGDKLPAAPSRKTIGPFAVRILSGAGCGAVLGATHGAVVVGAIAGAVGGAVGTLGGFDLRRTLARAIGRDFPAAVVEDVVAVGIAVVAVWMAAS